MAVKSLRCEKMVIKDGDAFSFLVMLMFLVPKNFVSLVVGALARIRFVKPMNSWFVGLFARGARINVGEAEKPLAEYSSIEELFTRKLAPDSRPISGPVCAPADGYLVNLGRCSDDAAVQAKGLEYPLGELIRGESAEPHPPLELCYFSTIYLAPHNYHRVHTPVSGDLCAIRYLPGELWPVNAPFVSRVPRLFTRNERMVFDIRLSRGGGMVYVVMVGALNVGRISTPFLPDFTSNSLARQFSSRPRLESLTTPVALQAGEELGTFMLGSTVVLAFDRKAAQGCDFVQMPASSPILMGQSLLKG